MEVIEEKQSKREHAYNNHAQLTETEVNNIINALSDLNLVVHNDSNVDCYIYWSVKFKLNSGANRSLYR